MVVEEEGLEEVMAREEDTGHHQEEDTGHHQEGDSGHHQEEDSGHHQEEVCEDHHRQDGMEMREQDREILDGVLPHPDITMTSIVKTHRLDHTTHVARLRPRNSECRLVKPLKWTRETGKLRVMACVRVMGTCRACLLCNKVDFLPRLHSVAHQGQ